MLCPPETSYTVPTEALWEVTTFGLWPSTNARSSWSGVWGTDRRLDIENDSAMRPVLWI
jgi:hypothetical protein